MVGAENGAADGYGQWQFQNAGTWVNQSIPPLHTGKKEEVKC